MPCGDDNLKKVSKSFIRLFIGYFVCAVGMVMTMNANIGFAPWDVLHKGISNVTGLTIGNANRIIGLIIVTIDILLGENIGWGTVFNMMFIGKFIDIIMRYGIIPVFVGFTPSLIMLLLGMLIIGYGAFIYIGAGYGAGPRDALMVGLTKKTGKSVRLVKSSAEILALAVGYLLGGPVGIGTAILAISGGHLYQFAFKTMNFDVKEVKHRYIIDDIRFIKEKILIKKQGKV